MRVNGIKKNSTKNKLTTMASSDILAIHSLGAYHGIKTIQTRT